MSKITKKDVKEKIELYEGMADDLKRKAEVMHEKADTLELVVNSLKSLVAK